MQQDERGYYFPADPIPSSKAILQCVPSQNGLFFDAPQRQRVTRFLTSYSLPSEDTTGMPPFTHSGPLIFLHESSTRLTDGSNFGSIGFPVFLSQATSLPEGQSPASSMAVCFALGSAESSVSVQVSPALWQKRAMAHRSSQSVRFSPGPSVFSARSSYGFLLAVSVPSKAVLT